MTESNCWPQRRQIWLVTPVGPAAATHMSLSGVCFWRPSACGGVSTCTSVCVYFCQGDKANTVSITALPNTSVDNNIIQNPLQVFPTASSQVHPNKRSIRAQILTCSPSTCRLPVTALPSVVPRKYGCRGCFYDCTLVAAMWGGPMH